MAQPKGERTDQGKGSDESRPRPTQEPEGARDRLERLRTKLKKLRREDPNIYPLF